MDDWALWEEENCWKAEDDWRKRESSPVSEGEEEIYRRMLRKYHRGDDDQ